MSKPHDHLVKQTFSDLAVARAFLQGTLPNTVSRALDWRTLRLAPTSLINELLEAREADLLFEVDRGEGGSLFIYLLLEHQSTPDRQMGRRLYTYIHHIWTRHEQAHPGRLQLPPVIPLVLYHGVEPWPGTRRLHDSVALEGLPADVGQWVPDFTYVLVDLRRMADAQLIGTALGRLVLLVLKYAAEGDLWERLPQWLDLLLQVLRSQGGMAAMSAIIRYIARTTPAGPSPEVQVFIRSNLGEPVMEVFESWADKLVKQGIEQGIERGLTQGRRETLLHMARARFGQLPPSFLSRVEDANADLLDLWCVRLLSATSLEGVFSDS